MGRLICIEGIDGAGKTTLVRGLMGELSALGVRVASQHARSLAQLSLSDADPLDSQAMLSLQDKAFAAYSRMYSHYRDHIANELAGCDVLLLDRYKWSFQVRWGCQGVNWGTLCSLVQGFELLPEADHTLFVQAVPGVAFERKMAAGIALTRPELGRLVAGRDPREAFIGMQSRAIGFYDDLHHHARMGSVTALDSSLGASVVLRMAMASVSKTLRI